MDERIDFLDKNLKPVVTGARVWDFCCGDGMNGKYALDNGAQYVYFSDVRENTFFDKQFNHITREKYSWRYINTDNIITPNWDIDIIIYHGQFYHARNHYQILDNLSQTNAKYICFESKGFDTKDFTVAWHFESQEKWTDTLEESDRTHPLVGAPSLGWCRYTFNYFGWQICNQTLEWREDLGCHKWRFWLER
jgi:hypothetical protein